MACRISLKQRHDRKVKTVKFLFLLSIFYFIFATSRVNMICFYIVGKKLFGDGYSGLEYDYRGLLRLYRTVGNQAKAAEYAHILQQWNQIRDRNNAAEVKPLDYVLNDSLTEIVNSYF